MSQVMKCTTIGCEVEATRIIAWPMLSDKAMFVAPCCDEHAAGIEVRQGGRPAAGPALRDAARLIEGIRA